MSISIIFSSFTNLHVYFKHSIKQHLEIEKLCSYHWNHLRPSSQHPQALTLWKSEAGPFVHRACQTLGQTGYGAFKHLSDLTPQNMVNSKVSKITRRIKYKSLTTKFNFFYFEYETIYSLCYVGGYKNDIRLKSSLISNKDYFCIHKKYNNIESR